MKKNVFLKLLKIHAENKQFIIEALQIEYLLLIVISLTQSTMSYLLIKNLIMVGTLRSKHMDEFRWLIKKFNENQFSNKNFIFFSIKL